VAGALASLAALIFWLATPAPSGAGEDVTRRAVNLLQENKAREAIAELQRIVTQQPSYFPAYSLLGVAYSQLGKPDLAQPYYQKAVNLAPSSNLWVTITAGFGVTSAAEAFSVRAIIGIEL